MNKRRRHGALRRRKVRRARLEFLNAAPTQSWPRLRDRIVFLVRDPGYSMARRFILNARDLETWQRVAIRERALRDGISDLHAAVRMEVEAINAR